MPSSTHSRVFCVRRIGKRSGTKCAVDPRMASENASILPHAFTYDACSASCCRMNVASARSASGPRFSTDKSVELLSATSALRRCIGSAIGFARSTASSRVDIDTPVCTL
jgi:hypothetical protein